MLKKIIFGLIFLGTSLALSISGNAAGLTTSFSEVTLEDLEIGKTYSTKEAANLPLMIVNTGSEPIDLKIELLRPEPSELKEGFEPIPDLGWIELEKPDVKDIQPKQAATTDVIISIPNEEQYLGKKYQVFIWSHTVGRVIGLGLKSKLLLNISAIPRVSVIEDYEPAMPPVTVIPEGLVDDKRR